MRDFLCSEFEKPKQWKTGLTSVEVCQFVEGGEGRWRLPGNDRDTERSQDEMGIMECAPSIRSPADGFAGNRQLRDRYG
ncbi:hypothetical Protein YC6258_03517 [Gynuella sunshinyii YC6258]|uniref:Uncharacterized protein n=1 Tax=Gynuella sunshinyii YC6258 TaxID=1445510 RepID=A0A0C5VQ39_9GAMM|nr:hypothetical Protein YC6258_03517 [Gynuella sunshinyii YC6258]